MKQLGVIELFSGIGSQAKALKNANIVHNSRDKWLRWKNLTHFNIFVKFN